MERSAESGPGDDPDPRFRLANERTFLAWSRTALALIAGGLAVSQLVRVGSSVVVFLVALALIGFGATMAYLGYRHFVQAAAALDRGEPVPRSSLPRVLSVGVVAFAVAAVGLAIMRLATR